MPSPLQYTRLDIGDHAPWFHQNSTSNPNYAFSTAAGRYIVMCFFVTTGDATGQMSLAAAQSHRHLFDDVHAAFFGISLDTADERTGRVSQQLPGLRYFWDFDGRVSRAYGALPVEGGDTGTGLATRRFWLVLDPTLRVMKTFPMLADGGNLEEIFAYIAALPPPERFSGIEVQAPILYLPNVFEPELCQRLIDAYAADGGQTTGFMRDVNGKTVSANDLSHKSRKDYNFSDTADDGPLRESLQNCIQRKIVPEIRKAYQFDVTRMERYIVACYDAADGGHFRPHRDNTSKGTAHRRFAVSINLNDEFEGGEIGFPEYGPRTFKPPIGAAVVFSCSLLHAVTKVTQGRRYAFLPFLYDDAAAKIRMENNAFLDENVGTYLGS